jgi:glycine/D-amino acid oxidase-like deaminating enzyme
MTLPTVAILGGGLMGAATALELATSGVAVLLIEQDLKLLNRASLRNEGKIHLGLIYANEGSLDTAGLQLEGALSFRRLLARWLGEGATSLPLSSRFIYLVADSSICSPDALEAHYARVDDLYRERLAEDPAIDYLGHRRAIGPNPSITAIGRSRSISVAGP